MRSSVFLTMIATAGIVVLLFSGVVIGQEEAAAPLPPGLFDPDPSQRISAIEKVARDKNQAAIGKIAGLLHRDPHSGVREAACRALGALGAQNQLDLLESVAVGDPNADVRTAAREAIAEIRGTQGTALGPLFPGDAAAVGTSDSAESQEVREKYRMPELIDPVAEPEQAKTFALGLGSMGPYGIASLDFRFRIDTGGQILPWIGLEVGGGWTPPGGYQLIAGRLDDLTDGPNRWKIIHGGGGVLLYLHRDHYIPLRGAFDLGQGPYGSLGYGYEQLNFEGFFSWGFEVGMLFHPGMSHFIDNLVDCDAVGAKCSSDDLWPVVPYVRFSLHFYLV